MKSSLCMLIKTLIKYFKKKISRSFATKRKSRSNSSHSSQSKDLLEVSDMENYTSDKTVTLNTSFSEICPFPVKTKTQKDNKRERRSEVSTQFSHHISQLWAS